MKKIIALIAFAVISITAWATDLPEAVVVALKPYGGTSFIESYDQYKDDGKLYYDIVIIQGTREIEILIDQDGNIVEVYDSEVYEEDEGLDEGESMD